ncbi:MAG: FIST C-terminal domain-containing protein [Candidatus Adiutrix sp.]|jgi:hypothetical protein|nr:FIST C-terminal domain-containing protein [Candidatus Adiutrix sp.]
MKVGVGFSDNPDTVAGVRQAAGEALKAGAGQSPCDLALVFFTARHEAGILRQALAPILGDSVPIIGGAAAGVMCHDRFGYAGDQIILAAIWLEGVSCQLFCQGDLDEGEEEAGRRLGRKMVQGGVGPDSPVFLFYDAIKRENDQVKLIMATPLLQGFYEGLGFLPNLVGAGLQGDYVLSPTRQLNGSDIVQHHALALAFSGNLRIDHVIMHGCRPATAYYTVTRADQQTILEINHRPALEFIRDILGPELPPEAYPFFLIFGINRGDKWGRFDEESYASRLCLAIDPERSGIVMFEPDMVAGTEFQVMYRSLDLSYMPPKIEQIFEGLKGRRPVLATYIDCAGRAAAYAGADLEDALVVQKTVDGRAPLMGLYTGVEIAPVDGRPRGLDWTGVFSLFSVPQ